MKLLRKAGSTSEIWQIFIQDSSSTTGAGLTGLTNASGGLTAYYHRDTDTTATAISLVTMTVGTFTSSGFKEIDATNMAGWYQFCPPNAALASGAKSCAFHLKGATNMAPLPIEVDLDAQVDVTKWNGTAVATPVTAGVPVVDVSWMGDSPVVGPAGTTPVTFPSTVASPTLVDTQLSGTHGAGSWASDTEPFDANVVTLNGQHVYVPAGTAGVTFLSTVAGVGSQMNLANGAITDAKITLPSEVIGPASTFFTKFLQLFNRFIGGKTTYNKVSGNIVVTKSDGVTTATTQVVTTDATNDVVNKAT